MECTTELKNRYFPNDPNWCVEVGDVLDPAYLEKVGKFDIVYSWGVLHHTGSMWLGIENSIGRVADGGELFIAIYNDQGFKSHVWWLIKYIYNKLPSPINTIYGFAVGFLVIFIYTIKFCVKLLPKAAISHLLKNRRKRGMSFSHDMIDWMGGFPYEFASYDLIEKYMLVRGLLLVHGKKQQV